MSKDNGGYAFPIPNADFQTFEPKTVDEYRRIQSGMTLRDYFAAKAMQSILTNEAELQRVRNHYREFNQIPAIAAMSYRLADAMLEARK